MAVTTYTTEAKLNEYLGSTGVINHADHNEDGTSDTGVISMVIEAATEEMNLYLLERYAVADLVDSVLVQRWCTKLAARFLCQLRGNPAPDSLELEFERITGQLAEIADGILDVPGVTLKSQLIPTQSNLRVDRAFSPDTIRVQQSSSSSAPSVFARNSTRFRGRLQ